MASKARELANLGNAYSDGALSNRNLIINGAMQVAQRGTSHTLTSEKYGSLDRWNGSGFSGPTCTMEQSTVAPANFKNSLKFTVTNGATVDATDYSDVRQYIEGNNVSHLKWGTADAQDVTVSFWVRCSVTGTFAVSICNSGYNRNYPATYVINSADTWEYKSVTISGDTSGTWLNNGGVGLRLIFDLGIGSTYSSTTGQWSSGIYFGGSGVTKLAATTGATWYVTGVQLEVGDTATPFEHRSYGQELALCKRYFQKSYNDGTPVGTATSNGQVNWLTSQQWGTTSVPTGPITQGYVLASPELRATATVVPYSPVTGTANRFYLASTSSDVTPIAWLQQAPSTVHIGYPQNAGGGGFSNTDTIKFHWTADAEL